MRILILLAQYHPAANPNVFRWSAIAEHWAGQGHEVHVLCSRRSGLPAGESIRGVWVHRAGHATLLDWAYNLLGAAKRRGEAEPEQGLREPSRWRRALERAVSATWRKLYWPDGSCLWYGPALRKAKQTIQAQQVEAIISVSFPFTAHLIGLACKRRFPQIRWLADSEDPFSILEAQPQNNFALYRRLNYRAEADVFRTADSLSATVGSTRQAYEKQFGALPRMAIVPPLFDELSWERSLEYRWEPEGPYLNLGYFGTFYTGIREPDVLLELLEQALLRAPQLSGKIRMHFFGAIGGEFVPAFARHEGIQSILRFHGLLPKVEALAAMRRMDVLVNIGNQTAIQLPSKCVDYLAAGRPILNLSHNAADAFRDFFETYPYIRHIDVTAPGAADSFHRYLEALQPEAATESPEQLQARLQPYTVGPIAGLFLDLLNRPFYAKGED